MACFPTVPLMDRLRVILGGERLPRTRSRRCGARRPCSQRAGPCFLAMNWELLVDGLWCKFRAFCPVAARCVRVLIHGLTIPGAGLRSVGKHGPMLLNL